MTEAATTPPTSEPVAGPVQRKLGHATDARWYCLDRDGVAMLCKDEADARAQVIENDDCWPGRAPHRAVLLGDVAAERKRWRELVEQLVACHDEPTCPAVVWAHEMLAGRDGPNAVVTGSPRR